MKVQYGAWFVLAIREVEVLGITEELLQIVDDLDRVGVSVEDCLDDVIRELQALLRNRAGASRFRLTAYFTSIITLSSLPFYSINIPNI